MHVCVCWCVHICRVHVLCWCAIRWADVVVRFVIAWWSCSLCGGVISSHRPAVCRRESAGVSWRLHTDDTADQRGTIQSQKHWVTLSFTHTHTHTFNSPFSGLPGLASTRKVKPIWILLKQETVSGSGISWAICKSSPHSIQITMPAPHHSVFYRPTSKHWSTLYLSLRP